MGIGPGSADGSSKAPARQAAALPQSQPLQEQVLRFYASRDFRPAWTGSAAAHARAEKVILTLKHADQQGLRTTDYSLSPERAAEQPKIGHDVPSYDVAITTTLLRYANDVRVGRTDPKAVYEDALLPPQSFDAAAELEAALEKDRIEAFLADLPPRTPQYRALASALTRYRAVAAKGGWPSLSHDTPPQKLARRLALEDARLAKSEHPSAAEIKEALKRFQIRHGLPASGNLDSETVKALDVPASYRIAQIAANMERWRWLPRQMGDRYILVDVPNQSVDYIKDGKSILHSRAIIGEDGENRTPILLTLADAIVVNPPWDIPDDIAAKAILPHLRKDPNYLATRNMVLVDAPKDDPTGTQINWRKVKGDKLPYQIREQPGPHNVLGTLMLDMPNAFDVYLHGTSNEATFGLKDRERSHGCVRVEKIEKLGELALEGSVDDPKEALKQDIAGGETQRVPLTRPILVYMLYWTAYVGKDGAVEFRPDRYDRDRPLIARLKDSGSATRVSSAADRSSSVRPE
jgi:murein L,D-transpeptidase YcbB/YkuD